jgi:hypothetical protein
MDKGLRVSLICILALIVGYSIYVRRFQIEAKVWHLRHGYSAAVGDYIVPVPDHWLIIGADVDGRDLMIMDTLVKRQAERPLTANMITVTSLTRPIRNLDFWESLQRQQLERGGQKEIEQRTLWAADEKVVCLGGYLLRDVLHVSGTTLLSLHCQSAGQLSLRFQGYRSGLEDFYAIASQIHKRR